jgi:hypothetical protein
VSATGVAAGLPLARSLLFIDTLHPVHEGRLFRWGYSPAETPLLEYGRTSPDALAASGFNPRDVEIAERWRHSPIVGQICANPLRHDRDQSLISQVHPIAAANEFIRSVSYEWTIGIGS